MKNVKEFVLVFMLIVGALGVVGCSKTKNDSCSIIGTWEYVDSNQFVYVFNEDGTGKYIIADNEMEFTYKIRGNKLSITYIEDTESFDTEYSIEDDVLNIKDSLGEDTLYRKK